MTTDIFRWLLTSKIAPVMKVMLLLFGLLYTTLFHQSGSSRQRIEKKT